MIDAELMENRRLKVPDVIRRYFSKIIRPVNIAIDTRRGRL